MDDATLHIPLPYDSSIGVDFVQFILDDQAIRAGLTVVWFLAGELSCRVGLFHFEDVLIFLLTWLVVLKRVSGRLGEIDGLQVLEYPC